jgi:hypothetical protein
MSSGRYHPSIGRRDDRDPPADPVLALVEKAVHDLAVLVHDHKVQGIPLRKATHLEHVPVQRIGEINPAMVRVKIGALVDPESRAEDRKDQAGLLEIFDGMHVDG